MAAVRPRPVQLRDPSSLTSEAYVAESAWQDARLARCPRHPGGGCGFARHGTYPRKTPTGMRIRRYYCPTARETFSLLRYETAGLTATAGSDYAASSGTLTFAPGETTKAVTIPLLNDSLTEGNETFQVRLSDPGGGAVLGGPSIATISIDDDESARTLGRWSEVLMWPFVAIHMALLPTEYVMFWEDRGQDSEIGLWDPSTGRITTPVLPGHDIFCAGHTFLSDGSLFVAGGHMFVGANGYAGLAHAASYNPFTNAWMHAPEMNAGRWYPTNTTLGNGDVLVISGEIQNVPPNPAVRNFLPQVWQAAAETWRDLIGAQNPTAHGGDLYPRMILSPDGRVFKAGPDTDTWFIDLSGSGSWTAGPVMNRGTNPTVPAAERIRRYAPAVIRDQKVFIFGGGENPPASSVETLDFNAAPLAWFQVPSMANARRHHNGTLLPDGTILITGGTSSPGFNNAAGAVMEAELYDPDTNTWSTLAPMQVKRLYHSTALLLPDGRVLSAGGGQPSAPEEDHDHRDAEIYSPPYLFKGPRPTITGAPPSAVIGQTFSIATPDAATIAKASLIRLGAVTHAFDQNQRYVTLSFSTAPGGLQFTVPANPNVCPPGYYMLFIVNSTGVPSVARMIHIDADAVNDAPTVSSISNRSTNKAAAAGPLSFVVNDVDTPSTQLVVSGASDHQLLVPNGGVTFGGSGANRSVTVAPASDQTGTANITVTVSDGALATSMSFLLTVNDPPTISTILDQAIDQDTPTGAIAFTVGDVETSATLLTVSGSSSNATLVPAANIAFGGTGAQRTVTVIPAAHQSGSATITIAVSDGAASAPSSFLLTVGAAQPPTNLSVFRPSIGRWFLTDQAAIDWGATGDMPVRGDFIGDGNLDVAVFRPANGTWYIDGGATIVWGAPGDIPVPGDYDGDGTTDIAVFRPSAGIFYIRNGATIAWGLAGDLPVVGDYNGDGIDDIAVYRPATGTWYVRNVMTAVYGLPADIPVPADYNGDGITDIAVFRPASGTWFIKDQYTEAWGLPGDVPVPMDRNGDGRAELGVFRRATGTWYFKNHVTNTMETGLWWGAPSDIPLGRAMPPVHTTWGDYDGDRKADLTVFRPSTGDWVSLRSLSGMTDYLRRSWGLSGDVPVGRDYDGDGKIDLAVFRPSVRRWFVLQSSTNFSSYVFQDWDLSDDIPVPADYDGDGKADFAAFRPWLGRWVILLSSTGSTSYATYDWGLDGDIPVPADYDGDGRTDLAVFRPSTSRWYILNRVTGEITIRDWGLSGDVPLAADFDGDGKADIAVFRPSLGRWFITSSIDGSYRAIDWGLSGDYVVPADYDGDGKADVAVFRPSTGTWYVRGLFSRSWGLSGDVPALKNP